MCHPTSSGQRVLSTQSELHLPFQVLILGRLVLEITETAILGGETAAARVIEDLILLGRRAGS